jgi:hypothetical protein
MRVNIALTPFEDRYSFAVAAQTPRKKLASALEALDSSTDRLDRLNAARRVRETAQELEATQIRAARKAGVTWSQIGACYGLTKQGAQQRFRDGEEDPAARVDTRPARPERRRARPDP